jgi:hypothetical protein
MHRRPRIHQYSAVKLETPHSSRLLNLRIRFWQSELFHRWCSRQAMIGWKHEQLRLSREWQSCQFRSPRLVHKLARCCSSPWLTEELPRAVTEGAHLFVPLLSALAIRLSKQLRLDQGPEPWQSLLRRSHWFHQRAVFSQSDRGLPSLLRNLKAALH